ARRQRQMCIRDRSIIEYYKKYYIPSNMIVSVCGDLNIEKVKSLINDKFSKINYTSRQILQLPLLKEEKKSKIFSVKKHKVQHTYFICGFLGPEIDSFYQYVGDISSIILGEGVSSRLNKVLKEEKKLVYEIGSGFYTQQGPSIFYISGVCDKKNLNKTIEIIDEIISNIRNVGVNKEEIEKAKNIILTRWYLNNESVHSIASNLAWWEMFRSIEELNNYIDNINKVTNEDIKSFFENYAKELIISALEPE
ncbi:MAG: insulinase family protein, partial [Endomicrobia bacterium]|nr:insulinase family protein [Endomicrobiia bacterium]